MTEAPREDRRGFTIIELLVVAVLGSLVLIATYNVLITNQRTYTVNAAKMQGQQTVRAGMELLFSELREISPSGGDLLVMNDDTVQVRVMRSAGLVCDTAGVLVGLTWDVDVVSLGDTLEEGDSAWIYIEHEVEESDDDEWLQTTVEIQDSTECQGRAAQTVQFDGPLSYGISDTITLGGLVRTYTTYTYAVDDYNGEYYLVRFEPGEDPVPLLGPVMAPAAGDGLSFEYLDIDGNVTGVATEVSQIVVTIRTQHAARDAAGNLVTDSLSARIYTRN